MTPATEAALSTRQAAFFGAIEIALPGRTLRLLDGAGVLTFAGRTFTGADDVFGAIVEVGELRDGVSDEAPKVDLTFAPPSDSAASVLASPAMQGAPVKMWFGAWVPATGLVVPDPDLFFSGKVNTVTLEWDREDRKVPFEIGSVWDRFFDTEQGNRLSPAFHKLCYPGELGLDFVTGVTERIYWGVTSPPRPVQQYTGIWSNIVNGLIGNGFLNV